MPSKRPLGQRVTFRAVRLASVLSRRALTAQYVLGLGDWFEVRGIHTGAISAEVVELEPSRNRPDQEFIGEPVRGDKPSWRRVEDAVALIRMGAPFPAAEPGALGAPSPVAGAVEGW